VQRTNDGLRGAMQAVKYMIDRYPSADISAETAAAYATDLSELDPTVLLAAVERAVRTCRFFPTIADIFAGVREVAQRASPTAEQEWCWVLEWISDSGNGRDSGHDLAERAVHLMGGWDWLGMGKVDDRPWRRKEFLTLYKQMERGDLLEEIAGPCERRAVGDGCGPLAIADSVKRVLAALPAPEAERCE
jgi:hypothetical protein